MELYSRLGFLKFNLAYASRIVEDPSGIGAFLGVLLVMSRYARLMSLMSHVLLQLPLHSYVFIANSPIAYIRINATSRAKEIIAYCG